MRILEIESTKFVDNLTMTAVLYRTSGSPEVHSCCHAIVLEESDNGFDLLCSSSCPAMLERTYLVQRFGFPHPSEVSLREEETLVVKGKIFAYRYSGVYGTV